MQCETLITLCSSLHDFTFTLLWLVDSAVSVKDQPSSEHSVHFLRLQCSRTCPLMSRLMVLMNLVACSRSSLEPQWKLPLQNAAEYVFLLDVDIIYNIHNQTENFKGEKEPCLLWSWSCTVHPVKYIHRHWCQFCGKLSSNHPQWSRAPSGKHQQIRQRSSSLKKKPQTSLISSMHLQTFSEWRSLSFQSSKCSNWTI